MLFFVGLILRRYIGFSSYSYFIVWLSLEVNMLMFIPLIKILGGKDEIEISIKYFLVQRVASAVYLLSVLLRISLNIELITELILIAIFLKLGVAPFQLWFISVVSKSPWLVLLVLSTWQKLLPLYIVRRVHISRKINIFIIATLVVVIFGSQNQLLIRKLLGYSSLFTISWRVIGGEWSIVAWLVYLVTYSLILIVLVWLIGSIEITSIQELIQKTITKIFQVNLGLTFLVLAGLPPFIGFISKLIVLEIIFISTKYFFGVILVRVAIFVLFFYLRIVYMVLSAHLTNSLFFEIKGQVRRWQAGARLLIIFFSLPLFII